MEMHALKARVQNGQVVLDEPAVLPEGAEVELYVVTADGMSDEERAALNASIERGLADAEAGRVVDAEVVLAKLRARSA